jgi:hypothetical protein
MLYNSVTSRRRDHTHFDITLFILNTVNLITLISMKKASILSNIYSLGKYVGNRTQQYVSDLDNGRYENLSAYGPFHRKLKKNNQKSTRSILTFYVIYFSECFLFYICTFQTETRNTLVYSTCSFLNVISRFHCC